MAIQLGQAFIALHADGAALAGEVRAQMEAALAEAQGTAGAAGAATGEGVAGTTVAAEEATASLTRMGAAGASAGAEIAAGTAEADAALSGLVAAEDRVGAAAAGASAEVAAASDRNVSSARRMTAATDAATKSSGLFGMSWKSIGELGAGVAIYESIKAAGNYEQQLTRLVTSANESANNLGRVRQGMLDLGSQVGFSGNQLAASMYIVESAGYHGAAGLTTLKAAAEIAKQENADLNTTAQAVTTTMRDFGYRADGAATVASKLNEAVAFGKTNLQDFSAALHSVEPNAAAAHIKLEDVLGSLSTMTNSGMTAQQAAQNLAHTLSNFENPSQPMINALSMIGLNANELKGNLSKTGLSGTILEVADAIRKQMGPAGDVAVNALNQNKTAAQALVTEMQNMPDAVAGLSQKLLDGSLSIKDYRSQVRDMGGDAGAMGMQFLSLYQSSDGFNSILKAGGPSVQTYIGMLAKSVGTVDALRTALLLASDDGVKVNAAIKGISDVTAQADGNVAKWNRTQGTFNQKLAEAKAAVENFGIQMGTKLLPILGQVASWVATQVVPAAQKLSEWFGKLASSQGVITVFTMLRTAAGFVAGAIGVLSTVIGTVVGWFSKLPSGIQAGLVAFGLLRVALSTNLFGLFSKYSSEAASSVARTGSAAVEATGGLREWAGAATETGGAAEAAAAKTTGLAAAWSDLKAKAAATAASVQASAAEMRAAYAETASAARLSADIQGASVAETRISGALAGTTGALRNLASSGFGAIKTAAGGLFSALGGWMTVGLVAGTAAVQLFSEGMAENTAIVKSATTAGNNLWATYAKFGGVFGDAAMQARELVRQQQGLGQVQYQAGVSTDTMTQALMGSHEAQKKAEASAGSLHDRWFALGHDLNAGNFGAIISGQFLNNDADKLHALFDGIDGVNTKWGQFNKLVDSGDGSLASLEAAAGKVWGPGNIFAAQTNAVNQALKALPAAGNDVAKQASALSGIWAAVGKNASASASATAQQAEAYDAVGHAFDNVGKGAITAAGDIDLTSKSGADLYGNLQNIATGAQNAADAAFKAAGGNSNLAAASKAAGDAMDKDYQAFMQAATAAGMGADQAAILAAKLGLVPGSVATKMLQPGMTEAQIASDILRGKIQEIPGSKDVRVAALTSDAITALSAAGYTVTHLPDGTFQVHANTSDANSTLRGLVSAWWNYPINVAVHAIAGHGGAGSANAFGNIVRAYDAGGFEPMAAGVPQIVGPNTWRIIGDRAATDEAYIPLDGSPRSRSLWTDAGRRMGLIGAGASGSSRGPVSVTYAPQYVLPPSADPTQVAAMVGANTARDFQLGMESLSSLGWAN